MDWDILSFVQDSLSFASGFHSSLRLDALGRRHKLDGPYDFEITTLIATAPAGGWQAVLSIAGVVLYMGESHRMENMMWSILGAEISGYQPDLDL